MPDSQPPIKARANANKTLAVVGRAGRDTRENRKNWTASRLERTCKNLHTCTGHRLQLAQRTCMQTCKKRRQTWKACSDRTSKHPCGQTSPPYDGRGPLHKSQPVALIARPLRAIGSSVLHQAGNLLNPVQPRTQQGNSPKPSRNTMPSSLGIGAWRPQA